MASSSGRDFPHGFGQYLDKDVVQVQDVGSGDSESTGSGPCA